MKEKRFTKRQLVCAVLLTAALTLGGVLLLLGVLLGADGLAVLEGFALIRTIFVEDADLKQVADEALFAMVDATGDRWTYYLDKDWNDAQLEYEANRTTGIGVRVLYREDGMLVTDVVPDGGADRAGIKAGETLRAVEGNPLYGAEQGNNVALISGESGSKVTLTVRGADGAEREVAVLRGTWYDSPIRYQMLEENVGYVRIFNFNKGTGSAFREAVEDLMQQGAESLVFDLRGNGGGFLDELIEMLDFLLPEGIVFRQTTSWGWTFREKSGESSVALPMVSLVDAESYSCAELFAAQLRESAGSLIIGEHTTGKGYFQYHFPMPNGGGLGLSIGRYTTGDGVSLAGVGIEPDAVISLDEQQQAYFDARWLKAEEDPCIQTALEQLKGK